MPSICWPSCPLVRFHFVVITKDPTHSALSFYTFVFQESFQCGTLASQRSADLVEAPPAITRQHSSTSQQCHPTALSNLLSCRPLWMLPPCSAQACRWRMRSAAWRLRASYCKPRLHTEDFETTRSQLQKSSFLRRRVAGARSGQCGLHAPHHAAGSARRCGVCLLLLHRRLRARQVQIKCCCSIM